MFKLRSEGERMMDLMQQPVSSEQFTLDQRVESLLGKLLAGTITAAERSQYENLVAKRSGMMRLHLRRRA